MDHLVSPFSAAPIEQTCAVAVLINERLDDVLAWLKFCRSLQGTFQKRSGLEHLSPLHINAIASLRNCPDSVVRAWFEAASSECGFKGAFLEQSLMRLCRLS